jgi:hypothetical protein
MTRLLRSIVDLVTILAAALALYYVGVFLAPHMIAAYRGAEQRIATGQADPGERGQSGLIYVESPEVYTRQRLVNDRYLQDAWLRARLEDIDAQPDLAWIETAEVERTIARLRLVGGLGEDASGAPDGDATPIPDSVLDQVAAIPFETRFRLQAQARDKIRQQILENALDDRHDLSGNTVFGLKFDTSILPGSATRLSPTVVVRMDENPLDRLLAMGPTPDDTVGPGDVPIAARDDTEGYEAAADVPLPGNGADTTPHEPKEFVRYFTRLNTAAPSASQGERSAILASIDEHFDDWRHNVERRLDNYRRGEPLAACRPADVEAPLCRGDALHPEARRALGDLLGPVGALDNALEYVTRRSEFDMRIGSRFAARILRNAEGHCASRAPEPAATAGADGDATTASVAAARFDTVRDFLLGDERTKAIYPVPGIWGQFFEAQPQFSYKEALETCSMEIDFSLIERDVALYFVPGQFGTFAPPPTLSPLACNECLNADEPFSVLIETRESDPEVLNRLELTLNAPTLGEMRKSISTPLDSRKQCYLPGSDGTGFMFEVTAEDSDDAESVAARLQARDDAICIPGIAVNLRLGAYEFFRRMSEVESYTYAAFPRGDVSGVVTEAGREQVLDAGLSAPAGGIGLSLGGESRTRRTTARPSLINFASGQSRVRTSADDDPELFDFGWTIVKDGPKEPMLASQLVLLSVPAYLDEIKLTVWKGFMDIDRAPLDREGSAAADDGQPFNEKLLEERIRHLMPSWEKRTITLNVPPDFAALDSIVIGRNEIFGPKINARELAEGCHTYTPDGYLHLVIPGERLWRSTVVTLDNRKADRIEVMPDMRGILGTFDPVRTTEACEEDGACGSDADGEAASVAAETVLGDRRLMVWTSESHDSAWVSISARGACRPRSSEAEVSPPPVQASLGDEDAAMFGEGGAAAADGTLQEKVRP